MKRRKQRKEPKDICRMQHRGKIGAGMLNMDDETSDRKGRIWLSEIQIPTEIKIQIGFRHTPQHR